MAKQDNKAQSSSFQGFWGKWGSYFQSSKATYTAPLPISSKPVLLLYLLRSLPYLCFAAFVLSLFWDSSGEIRLAWRTEAVSLDALVRKISATGLVGFLTNWLAIKMLFYPRTKRPLLGQGLIPAHKARVVMRLGDEISREIINSEIILKKIKDSQFLKNHRQALAEGLRKAGANPEFQKDLLQLLWHYLQQSLRSKAFQAGLSMIPQNFLLRWGKAGFLAGALFKLYHFFSRNMETAYISETILKHLKTNFQRYERDFHNVLKNILKKLPLSLENSKEEIDEKILSLLTYFIDQINVQGIIMDNLQSFDEARLERLLRRSTSDQLAHIQYLGCFFGMIGGVFLWLPYEALALSLILLLSIGLADSLIYKTRQRKKK